MGAAVLQQQALRPPGPPRCLHPRSRQEFCRVSAGGLLLRSHHHGREGARGGRPRESKLPPGPRVLRAPRVQGLSSCRAPRVGPAEPGAAGVALPVCGRDFKSSSLLTASVLANSPLPPTPNPQTDALGTLPVTRQGPRVSRCVRPRATRLRPLSEFLLHLALQTRVLPVAGWVSRFYLLRFGAFGW